MTSPEKAPAENAAGDTGTQTRTKKKKTANRAAAGNNREPRANTRTKVAKQDSAGEDQGKSSSSKVDIQGGKEEEST